MLPYPTAACFAPPEVCKPSLVLGTSGYDDICIADWSESNDMASYKEHVVSQCTT